jgi:hypothetical protein
MEKPQEKVLGAGHAVVGVGCRPGGLDAGDQPGCERCRFGRRTAADAEPRGETLAVPA